MYKSESVLGLVGSIIAIVTIVFLLLGILFFSAVVNLLGPDFLSSLDMQINDYTFNYIVEDVLQNGLGVLAGFAFLILIVPLALSAGSVILGFIGYSKLKKDVKNGGVLLIIAGALSFLSGIGFIPFVLFLVGGIMAVTKKELPSKV